MELDGCKKAQAVFIWGKKVSYTVWNEQNSKRLQALESQLLITLPPECLCCYRQSKMKRSAGVRRVPENSTPQPAVDWGRPRVAGVVQYACSTAWSTSSAFAQSEWPGLSWASVLFPRVVWESLWLELQGRTLFQAGFLVPLLFPFSWSFLWGF